MRIARQVAYGFVVMASAIALLVTFLWVGSQYLNPWIGIPVFAVLTAAFGRYGAILVKRFSQKRRRRHKLNRQKTS